MSAGTRDLLLQLAANILAGKKDAEVVAEEIVPWIAVNDLWSPLFDRLVAAVLAGDGQEQGRLLDALAGTAVAA